MNKCKGGGALKYTFTYNINKQTKKQVKLITIILMQYIAWKNGEYLSNADNTEGIGDETGA